MNFGFHTYQRVLTGAAKDDNVVKALVKREYLVVDTHRELQTELRMELRTDGWTDRHRI